MWLILTLLLSSPAVACDNGCEPYENVCACRGSTNEGVPVIYTTDEKPPRHPEPAWERMEVKAALPPSCAVTNNCSDQQAIDAAAEGKRKAGLK